MSNASSQSIKVKVMDNRDGTLLSGAKVEPLCSISSSVTGSNGEVNLSLKLNDCCDIKISKPGYASYVSKACNVGETVEVFLNKEFTIKGTLKDESGKPLNRARITLKNSCGDGKRVGYTDALGSFKLNPLAIENCCYEMEVTHYDYPKNVATFCTDSQVGTQDVKLNIPISSEEAQAEVIVLYIPREIAPATTPSTVYTPPTPTYVPPVVTYSPPPATYIPPPTIYSPPVTYTPPPTVYTPPISTYTPPPTTNMIITESGYINPIDISSTTTTPFTFNFTYFDYNQSEIRPDAYANLDNIVAIMKGNADIIVEVSGHCDSRGPSYYNQSLSERRARAVVDYLIDKGISKRRLISKGYGEAQLINHCANDIDCSEEEHQQNRRSQYQVQGSIYDLPPIEEVPAPAATSTPQPKPAVKTEPLKVPCPDCPIKELDSEEYFDENFYDEKEYEDEKDDGGGY